MASNQPHAPFESFPHQQQADLLGMWMLLVTELLLFGTLLTAYAVYRVNHPEIFAFGIPYMNRLAGGLNTAILLTSSFTMAWSLRALQLHQRAWSRRLLAVTALLGVVFLGIKMSEYREKFQEGLLVGEAYQPHQPSLDGSIGRSESRGGLGREAGPGAAPFYGVNQGAGAQGGAGVEAGGGTLVSPETRPSGEGSLPGGASGRPVSQIPPAASGPSGLAAWARHGPRETLWRALPGGRTFFAFYFALTGLHALHVLIGLAAIGWIYWRLGGHHFDESGIFRLQCVGLYWHLVDLIWIFLFPLLYLAA